jgi:hypothetical protein
MSPLTATAPHSLLDTPSYLTVAEIKAIPTRPALIDRARLAQERGNLPDYMNLLNYLINGEGQSLPKA